MSTTVSSKRRSEIACGVRIKQDAIHFNKDLPDECWARIARQREKEKSLVPLRIDARTVIYVKPENCNPEYARAFIDKYSAAFRSQTITDDNSTNQKPDNS